MHIFAYGLRRARQIGRIVFRSHFCDHQVRAFRNAAVFIILHGNPVGVAVRGFNGLFQRIACHDKHGEAAGRKLHGFLRDHRMNLIRQILLALSRLCLRGICSRKMQHADIGILIQAAAHKADGYIHAAGRFIYFRRILRIHNMDVEHSGQLNVIRVRAQSGSARIEIRGVRRIRGQDFLNAQSRSLHRDAGCSGIGHFNVIGCTVRRGHGLIQCRGRHGIHAVCVRGKAHTAVLMNRNVEFFRRIPADTQGFHFGTAVHSLCNGIAVHGDRHAAAPGCRLHVMIIVGKAEFRRQKRVFDFCRCGIRPDT